MKVLVDTSVWSLALRKKDHDEEDKKAVDKLAKLIRHLDMVMIGPIRQEILSGINHKATFEDLRKKLGIFEDLAIDTKDYELAAKYFNECRSHGIQGSHVDYLICSVAVNNTLKILTLDKDFSRYQKYLPIAMDKIA